MLFSAGAGAIGLYVGRATAQLETKIIQDATARENRLADKLDALANRFQDKLDTKADKAAHIT